MINFNSSPVTSDFNLGMTGEHNAAQLLITPPENLSSDERTSHYRIAFFSANKTYLSEAKTGESFAVALSSAVTKNPSLDIQLIAYDDEGEFIGKSERINDFKFEPSISGTAVEIGEENEDIANEIVKISDSLDTIQSSLAGEIARASEKENLLDREKVDKVSGKGLSANDFTDSEKQKLASLENYNDSGILARLAYAEDDITDLETGKVDKVSGKGLSSNDFTNSEREKLASLNGRVFFGTCSSAANASTKEVSTDAGFSLTQGVIIVVSFANASGGDNLSPRYLNVNSSGAKRIANTNSPFLESWQPFDANSIITFVYCGDRWIQTDCYYADSTDFGQVKLSDSLSENKDSSWHIAASAKAAYDLENKKVDKPSALTPINFVPKSNGMGGYSWQEEHGGDLSYITHITWNENTPEYSSGYDWNALLEAYESGKKVGVYDDDYNVLAWFNDFSDDIAVTIVFDEPAPARAHIYSFRFSADGIAILSAKTIPLMDDIPDGASTVAYSNVESGLDSVTVQDAIDELASGKVDAEAGKGLSSNDFTTEEKNKLNILASLPQGTNNGDILLWDSSQNKYVSKPKWQMIYQPVEYIEATGTQWINTGLKGADGVDIDFEIIQNVQTNIGATLFSAREMYGSTVYGLEHYTWDDFCIGRFSQDSGVKHIPELYQPLSRHQLRYGTAFENKIYVDGEYYSDHSSVKQYSSPTSNMCLFKYPTSDNDKAKARIYSARFYIGSTLVRDYIPVYNIYTGEAGMFDMLEKMFYGNNGSGTFLKGADV
ncbi:MAG: hypothetical protein MJ173_02270 [Clostridia bacterium]|nr:hypothetical protein [Clostridia bacterium]